MTRNPIPFLVGRVSSDFRFCSSPNNSPRPLQRLDYPSDTAGDTGTPILDHTRRTTERRASEVMMIFTTMMNRS